MQETNRSKNVFVTFKGTDIEISISGRKRTAAFRLSLTLQKRRIRPVARSVLIIERGVELHNEKP